METADANNSDLFAKKLALQAVLKLKTEELRKLCLSEAVSIYLFHPISEHICCILLYTIYKYVHMYLYLYIYCNIYCSVQCCRVSNIQK